MEVIWGFQRVFNEFQERGEGRCSEALHRTSEMFSGEFRSSPMCCRSSKGVSDGVFEVSGDLQQSPRAFLGGLRCVSAIKRPAQVRGSFMGFRWHSESMR